jgi:putative ABC transport system permease protein
MERLLKDFTYAMRSLVRHPTFTVVAVVTLGLGIGVNTAIFSIVNTVLLRALPFPNPERLVSVGQVKTADGLPGIGAYEYLAWREENHSFENLAAHSNDNFNLSGVGEPERLKGGQVTASFFPTLGINPIRGRVFLPEEDQPGGNLAVVISEAFWQRRFGRSESVIGNSLVLDNKTYTIVGVAPGTLRFPSNYDIWVPLQIDKVKETTGDMIMLVEVVGRLKPTAAAEPAQTELTLISRRASQQRADKLPVSPVEITPLHQFLVAGVRRTVLILWIAVSLIMLLACANVANLMLSRTVARQREMAVRSAVGARRWQLIRQLLVESVSLSLAGGVLGILIAVWCKGLIASLVPTGFTSSLHDLSDSQMDWRVFGFTLLLSILTGVVFGLAPSLSASKPDLVRTLREGSFSSLIGFGLRSVRGWLVVTELAFAIVLLIGAGLLVRSFDRLLSVDVGYARENVLTARINLPRTAYPKEANAENFYNQLIEKLKALPGVSSAGVINHTPFSGYGLIAFTNIEGYGELTRGKDSPVGIGAVSPDYFQTLKIPLLQGRMVNDRDREGSQLVAVVNQEFARRFFANNDAIGKRISFGCKEDYCRTIVGVVGSIRQESLTDDVFPEIYLPFAQMPINGMTVFVRTESDPLNLAAAMRQEVFALDKNQPVYDVQTLDHRINEAVSIPRALMFLFGSFALLALILAAVGIYGIVSYSVNQRMREIGIRLALGAQQSDVLRLILRNGVTLAILGIAIGIGGAIALTRFMKALLFGVTATDLATFVFVSIGLFIVAVVACLIPARRATKVDPLVALRYE